MAHYFTDENKIPNKVAGNFNPVYNVNQLVVEKKIDTATTSLTIGGLDLVADGGVYDIVISFLGRSASTHSYLKFNNSSDANYYFCETGSTRYVSNGTGEASAGGWAGISTESVEIPLGNYKKNLITATITISDAGYLMIAGESFGMGDYLSRQSFSGTYNVIQTNLTSINISSSSNFDAGSTIRVYKRIVNETISNAHVSFLDAHPIGSYYICATGSGDPALRYGGKWTQIATNVTIPLGGTVSGSAGEQYMITSNTNGSSGCTFYVSAGSGVLNYLKIYNSAGFKGSDSGGTLSRAYTTMDLSTTSQKLEGVDIWRRDP